MEVPLKILIVEDSDSDLELILRELKKSDFDFSYDHCENEKDYKKSLIRFQPDVILSDHNLPSFNSVDALIKAREFNPHIPFILVSGYIGEDEAVDMIVNKGANDFILKDNLVRLNPAIVREFKNYKLKFELEQKTEQLKRLSMVASHTHNGVIITNKKGEIEWVNEGYTNLTGYTLNDCFGQKPGDILQGKNTDQETVKRISKKLTELKPFTEEILNYHKNGTPYWIKLDITPIEDGFGELTNFIAIQEDITERKKFEYKLIQANERLEEAQEIGEIGNWEFDLSTQKIHWSKQIFNIYERDQLQENPTFEELKKYHPNDPYADKVIQSSLKEGKAYDLDTELITSSGETKFIRTVGIPMRDSGGKVIKFKGVVQDITKRKRIENELFENQKKLKNITDNIPGVVLRYKLYNNGTEEIDFISDAVENIFEVSQEVALKDCSHLWSQILPDDIKKTQESIQKSANTMSIWDHFYRIETKSGKLKWLHAIGTPIEKTDDYVVWDTILLEKTKEKQFEQFLKESNLRLLEAQKLARIGDWSIDFEKKETFISPMVKKIHDVPDDFEFDIEKGLQFFKEGYDRDRKRKVIEEAIKTGTPYSEELRLITAKGKEIWVRTIGQAEHKNGKCTRVYGTLMDITSEKEHELIRKKNEERLNAAVSGADLGIWDSNLKTGEAYVNNQFLQMLGYDPGSIEYNTDFFISILHPDDIHLPGKEVERIEKGGVNNIDIILRLKDSKGNYRRILDRGSAVEFDKDGKVVRLVGTHSDITESLELRDNLSKSLREKTVLLSEIHHRVKNNLAIVSGLLDLKALESEDKVLKETLYDMGQRIKSIAGVHELLYEGETFSDIKMDQYLSKLIKNINTSILGEKDINFKISVDNELKVNINQAVPIGLLLNELVTNSFKYAFADVERPKIKFSIKKKENHLIVSYSDNGPGMDSTKITNPSSLGTTLINTLLSQLNADYLVENKNGFNLSFSFEEQKVGAHSNLRK